MSPIEYLLFFMNMVFFVDYCMGTEDGLPLASDSRVQATQLMALIDQLLLFFFALKVCLSFSEHINLEVFQDEIQADQKEEEARLLSTLPSQKPAVIGACKGSKFLKKGFKAPPSAPLTPLTTTSDKLLEDERRLIQNFKFQEAIKRARLNKNQHSLTYTIEHLKASAGMLLRVALFCGNLIALMFAVALD